MKVLQKLLKFVVRVLSAIFKAPVKLINRIGKTSFGPALFSLSLLVGVVVMIVAYQRGAENFAIYQQEATLNPINNK